MRRLCRLKYIDAASKRTISACANPRISNTRSPVNSIDVYLLSTGRLPHLSAAVDSTKGEIYCMEFLETISPRESPYVASRYDTFANRRLGDCHGFPHIAFSGISKITARG